MTDSDVSTELDADGILLARIDMPGRAMNVFSPALMDSLEYLIERMENDPSVRALVLTSGKPAFLAGADLEMIRMFTEQARSGSTADLNALFGRLGRLFRRLECLPKPVVAAINGLALGGGLEVCMACHARVAANDPSIQLGLPEIKLGLLPGAGGTQRLPRLAGTAKGLEMLLTGNPVNPADALALGLIDELAPAAALISSAKRRARSMERPVARWDAPGARFPDAPFDFSDPSRARAQITVAIGLSREQLEHYPAYQAIIDCVVDGWLLPMTEGCEHEMRIFVELMRDPVAGNMVRALFLNRQKAAKAGLFKPDSVLARDDDALLPRLRRARDRAQALRCSEEQRLLAIALSALVAWDENKVPDPEVADAVVVAEGLHPAYTGGPFSYARHCGLSDLHARTSAAAALDGALFAMRPGVIRFLNDGKFAVA
jgi:enoyl-CoA hydratase/carnithine racemase